MMTSHSEERKASDILIDCLKQIYMEQFDLCKKKRPRDYGRSLQLKNFMNELYQKLSKEFGERYGDIFSWLDYLNIQYAWHKTQSMIDPERANELDRINKFYEKAIKEAQNFLNKGESFV